MPTVNFRVFDSSNTAVSAASVICSVVTGDDGPATLSSGNQIAKQVTGVSDASGLAAITLPCNASGATTPYISSPTGTYYAVKIVIDDEPAKYQSVLVPNGAGPYEASSIRINAPGSLPDSSALDAHISSASPHPNEVSSGGVIQRHAAAVDDTAPGKVLGIYTLTPTEASAPTWAAHPGGAAYDITLSAASGDVAAVTVDARVQFGALDGGSGDYSAVYITAATVDAGGTPISYFHASGASTPTYAWGSCFDALSTTQPAAIRSFGGTVERTLGASDIIGGEVTVRVFVAHTTEDDLTSRADLVADETSPLFFKLEIKDAYDA